MANQKISDLRSLNAETVSREDLIPIVDVSSPTAVGGELKRISVNQLIGHVSDMSLIRVQDTLGDFYLKTGGTISGDVSITGTISVNSGGSFSGQLHVPIVPILSSSAASKQYVDNIVASSLDINGILTALGPSLNTKYDKTGGTISGNTFITGNLTVSGSSTFVNNINVPSTPISITHATSKGYVDSLFSNVSNILQILQVIYPVGALYISTLATNPNTIFGFGTWTTFATGSVLVGINPSDPDFNVVEKTGGAKSVALDEIHIPAHRHGIDPPLTNTTVNGEHTHHTVSPGSRSGGLTELNYTRQFSSRGEGGLVNVNFEYSLQGTTTPATLGLTSHAGAHTHTVDIPPFDSGLTGGGQAHNNLQPYVVVYMWKRVA